MSYLFAVIFLKWSDFIWNIAVCQPRWRLMHPFFKRSSLESVFLFTKGKLLTCISYYQLLNKAILVKFITITSWGKTNIDVHLFTYKWRHLAKYLYNTATKNKGKIIKQIRKKNSQISYFKLTGFYGRVICLNFKMLKLSDQRHTCSYLSFVSVSAKLWPIM